MDSVEAGPDCTVLSVAPFSTTLPEAEVLRPRHDPGQRWLLDFEQQSEGAISSVKKEMCV